MLMIDLDWTKILQVAIPVAVWILLHLRTSIRDDLARLASGLARQAGLLVDNTTDPIELEKIEKAIDARVWEWLAEYGYAPSAWVKKIVDPIIQVEIGETIAWLRDQKGIQDDAPKTAPIPS